MTFDELKRRFPQAGPGFIAANLDSNNPRTNPVMEHRPVPVPLAKDKAQEESPERLLIRIVSVRKRLIDPDNLCEKWLLDCLRFVGAISGDEPDKITLETSQRKAQKGEEEHTEITIDEIV